MSGLSELIKAAGELNYRWIVLGVAFVAQATASVVSQGAYVMVPARRLFFEPSGNWCVAGRDEWGTDPVYDPARRGD